MTSEATSMTTIDRRTAPPAWAEELLTWMVPESPEEGIPGGLLEEYRDTVLPSRGRSGANLWYVLQVGGFLARLTWMFVLLHAGSVVFSTLFDLYVPGFAPHIGHPRTAMLTAVSAFLAAGSYAGYRLGHVRASGLAAATTSAAGFTLALMVYGVFHYTVVRHDPSRLNLFYVTGGWEEAVGMPIVITMIAAPLGLLGGAVGQYLRRLADRRHSRSA